MLTSLDDKSIAESRRLLLTAVARAENTGQTFLDGKRAIPDFGRAPVQAEPVRATVAIPGKAGAVVHALDATGRRSRRLPAIRRQGTLVIDTTSAQSPWLEIVVP